MRPPKLLRDGIRALLRQHVPWLLYPRPAGSLQPERLYAYLDALWQRRELEGTIVEVGCWIAGTSALAWKMLERTGYPHRYLAIDTFSGFPSEQFERDVALGTPEPDKHIFDANSPEMVRQLLEHWDAPGVELLQADIAKLEPEHLPSPISVALVDVDLELPVHESLKKIWPRLEAGGLIMVDDCPEQTTWVGARRGYRRFMEGLGLEERYFMGMGLVSRPA
jgi:O-methyltransferase